MPINRLYNKTATTTRLADVGESKKQEWASHLTGLRCAIHPISGDQSELAEGGFYKTFKLFCPVDTDILIGDKVIESGDTYIVKGVKTYDFGSTENVHIQAIIVLGE